MSVIPNGSRPRSVDTASPRPAVKENSTGIAVRLFVVCGHAIVRRALVEQFTEADGFEVVCGVSCLEETAAAAPSATPDVLLFSLAATSVDCASAGRFLRNLEDRTRLVVLTGCDPNALILHAVLPYATGIVSAIDPPELVAHAVREAATHRTFVSDALRDRFLKDDRGIRMAPPFQSPLTKLTKRELEILRYVATGSSQRSIATAEHISVKTVDSHCTNLMRKLDIHDRVELTRFAIREGLVRA